jgi:hypothetical protein
MCRPLIPNFKDDSDEADAIKRTFRDIIQDHARDTSFLASYVKIVPGASALAACVLVHHALNLVARVRKQLLKAGGLGCTSSGCTAELLVQVLLLLVHQW